MTAKRKIVFWSAALGTFVAINLGAGMTDAAETKAKMPLTSRVASAALKGRCATQCREVVINKSDAILKNCVKNCGSEVQRLLKTLEARLTDKQDQKGERGIDKLKEDIAKKQGSIESLKILISQNKDVLKLLKEDPKSNQQKIKSTGNQLRNQRNDEAKREKELKRLKALEKEIERKNANLDREIATLARQIERIRAASGTSAGEASTTLSLPDVSLPDEAGKKMVKSVTPSHPSSAPSRLPPALPKRDHAPMPSKEAVPLSSSALPPPLTSHNTPASVPPSPPPLLASAPAPSSSPTATPNRANLLAQIQEGTTLKKADSRVSSASKQSVSSLSVLANEEMLKRRRAMNIDEDEHSPDWD